MSPVAQAILASWSFPAIATAINILAALIYLRGWVVLAAAAPARFTAGRVSSFLSGLAILELALASPIDAFDPLFLTDHMLQHVLLMMIVPPLILLGEPQIPLLRGLPRWISQRWLGPILAARPLRSMGRMLVDPTVAWLLMAIAMIGWHLPEAYELALHSQGWHELEHLCFLTAAMFFWWPVIQPWPSRAVWPRWSMPIYLLLADFVNSILSAFLAFSERVLYPSYLAVPRLWGISAQNDQVAAGAMMWVIGSFAFLIPAVAITVKLLSPAPSTRERPRITELAVAGRSVARRALAAGALLLPVAALAYGWLAPKATDIDQAALRVKQASGPFRVSVFAPPDPVKAGLCDVSVLVQDNDSQAPLLDADVDIAVEPSGNRAKAVRASYHESVNKLLSSATADLPNSGAWSLQVSVRRGSEEAAVATTLRAVPSELQRASAGSHPGTFATH